MRLKDVSDVEIFLILALASIVVLILHLVLTRFTDADILVDALISFVVAFIIAALFVAFKRDV
ncbi:MAG: hypothetical protein M1503_12250 [Thaumarchaeota archaeon]|nr:hypothetical protein [Nitrososphaerota archaeon]MCL5319012.1 hypothetical protein [Nitrososphaerota archaeon]